MACSIVAARHERKHGNKIISIDDIIRNKIGMEDLDDNLKKIAIIKTQERRNEIINLSKTPISSSYSTKLRANIKELGNVVKEFGLPKAIERHDKDNYSCATSFKGLYFIY
ncbi:hypothetical protein [Rickettsia montanensis]|uniref:Uncharacterized protein n=1 Tax=Rickettsia montanensis (strain OSU 85-930) TaxID=1105114 RepID=H8KD29_RICMS|nr:hypothetical protein [Rickettsia montanensis]AFC73196.1 hypothetical protein MCI_01205 [Rickettsia montanensis str. OSU 85-930]AFC74020.1 hypothetical protein MCI_06075 [Rickettsia montanensis str. OSU 85-930]